MNERVPTPRLGRGLAAGLACLSLLAGSVSLAWPESMRLRLALPTSPASYMLPLYVAKDQGWLAKAGLEVEENYMTGDAAVVRAILSDNADIGAPGVFAVYPAIAEGGKIKAFGSWQPTTDYWIFAHKKFTKVEDLKDVGRDPAGIRSHDRGRGLPVGQLLGDRDRCADSVAAASGE